MITFPNCKINLGLRVVSRRADGYHDLETVFYPIPLFDALEIVPAADERGRFTQSGIQLDGNADDNLVLKAYRLLSNDFDLPQVDVYLRKNVPVGAGLGGGSSDAAFMLKLLNEYASLHLNEEKLEQYAARLGADCPFFIRNKPVLAKGTGNQFSEIDLSLRGYFLYLVKPDIFISTKEAFAAIVPGKPETSVGEIVKLPVDQWKGRLLNDFEESVSERHPEIRQIKETLYVRGAMYAAMSGSGSSVFGIFKIKPEEEPVPGWDNYQTFILSLEI